MLMRLTRELGRLLGRLWAEQAVCASGRDFDQDATPAVHGDALAG